MAYNQLEKLRDNIEAIRIALTHDRSLELREEQVAQLSRYSGFGGLKQILLPDEGVQSWRDLGAKDNDMRLYEPMMELHQLLKAQLSAVDYKITLDSLKNSVLTAFYTPELVPDNLYKAFKEIGLQPQTVYDPSAGAGVFLERAVHHFPGLQLIGAVEKDFLTGNILELLSTTWETKTNVQILPFEESSRNDDHKYDLVVSNIPFGNFNVFDPKVTDPELKKSIHNYFFSRGLDKVREGGLLAFLTTDGFLNSPGNAAARRYLFQQADFISVLVMPDNLMKDSANTEAPSHLLIVQRRSQKQALSYEEELLLRTMEKQSEFGPYSHNHYLALAPDAILGDEVSDGKNQYGSAHQMVWQNAGLEELHQPMFKQLRADLERRVDRDLYHKYYEHAAIELPDAKYKLTFKQMPESPAEIGPLQQHNTE